MTSDPSMRRLPLGSCPDSWGVWFDDPQQTPWSRFLDDLAQVGYEWLELGPYGCRPTDPPQLRDELGSRDRQVAGGLETLQRLGFGDSARNVMTSWFFPWEGRARDSSRCMRETIDQYVSAW